MTGFEETAVCRAPALEVWKLLYDPSRFVDWWSGLLSSDAATDGAVVRTELEPDIELPLRVDPARQGSGVVIRCLTNGTVWAWALEPHPRGCLVRVRVDGLDAAGEATRERLRTSVLVSLPRLVSAAERASAAHGLSSG